MSDDDHQERNQEKKPRESIEEFCARLGVKLHRSEKGGVEFAPFHGGNLLHKRPKRTSKDPEPGGAKAA